MNRLQTSRLSAFLLRLTTVVVLCNGASAFGACCFDLPPGDLASVAAVDMPCHQKEEATATHASDCCMTCVSVVFTDGIGGTPGLFISVIVPASLGGPPSDRHELLYRPPISHLS